MKNIQTLLLVAFAVASILSCDKKTKKEQVVTEEKKEIKSEMPIKAENLQTTQFTIKGMSCAVGCAKFIEKELSEQNGVQKAIVDFERELAMVVFDKEIQNPKKLATVVEAVLDGKTYKVVLK